MSSSSASASGPISIGVGGRGDSGEDLLFELAVKGFQAELDLDDASVIRDRWAANDCRCSWLCYFFDNFFASMPDDGVDFKGT